MNDHRLTHLTQDASVDLRIVVGTLCGSGKRAARHHHEPAVHGLDCLDLLFIGADDVVDANSRNRIEMVRPDAAADLYTWATFCGLECVTDQFTRRRPIESAAALSSIHRFCNAEPEIPKVMPKVDGLLPVDCGVEPGIDIGERVRHYVSRRKRDAVEALGSLLGGENDRLARRVRLELAIVGRQGNYCHGVLPIT